MGPLPPLLYCLYVKGGVVGGGGGSLGFPIKWTLELLELMGGEGRETIVKGTAESSELLVNNLDSCSGGVMLSGCLFELVKRHGEHTQNPRSERIYTFHQLG